MEKNMALIAYKVNDVLTKLDQFEDSNRELSARIRSLSANWILKHIPNYL